MVWITHFPLCFVKFFLTIGELFHTVGDWNPSFIKAAIFYMDFEKERE